MKVNSIVLNNIYSKTYKVGRAISFKDNTTPQADQFVTSATGQDIKFEKKLPENSTIIKSETVKSAMEIMVEGLKKFFKVKTDANGVLTDDGLSDLVWAHVYAL